MNEALEKLIQALREELQQYGEMLARLDQQQEHVTRRASEDLLQSTSEIELHSQTMKQARQVRTDCQATVARELGLESDATFAEIIPKLHGCNATIGANNLLLFRCQSVERSRRGHGLGQ